MTTEYLTQDLDYYKATMSQLEYIKHPETEVTFTLKNRADSLLSEYVAPGALQAKLDTFRSGWQPEELAYLASLQNQDGTAQFTESYLDYLADNPLPPVTISLDEHGDIAASTTGPWPLVTFWETVIMSELNEEYYKNKLARSGQTLDDVYREGDRRLSEKIELLKTRPDIKFADFGTRRRFSYEWHKHVIERVAMELPDNFVGTSNIYLAYTLGLKPIGTFAHELPMVYAALADKAAENPLNGHNRVLQDWQELYKGDLSTALTDTFTSDFFFADFTPEQARLWKSLRHDSGDPFEFGEKVIAFFKWLDIDPLTKMIVFSDGLDVGMIIQLDDYFKGRIAITFGWGTTLTNDLGIKANNFVAKATAADGVPTVKLADTEGKHTGPEEKVVFYQGNVAEVCGRFALKELVAA